MKNWQYVVGGPAADILIFAIEAGRYGPARLPQNLARAGLRVATLCPSDNALARTDHAFHAYMLPRSRSARRLARALRAALADCRPHLIVPGDEQAVVLLHSFIRGTCADIIGERGLAILLRSLGRPDARPDRLDAMLFKSETLSLARQVGVRVPPGGTVASLDQALQIAGDVGYPVYLKQSFGWAGQGVVRCASDGDLIAAYPRHPSPYVCKLRSLARKVLGRSWYPGSAPIDVQGAIAGAPAMYCVLAWQGRMVAGFAGHALHTNGACGPSSEVRIGPDAAMAEASRRMVEALGCTGFVGFDFMEPADGGEPVLLECNPRPIQVGHLGYRIGVDLAAQLARLVRGGQVPARPLGPTRDLEVVLFPYALDPARLRAGALDDIPATDQGLMDYGAEEMRK